MGTNLSEHFYFLLLLTLFFSFSSSNAQDSWELKTEKDSIKIYSRKSNSIKYNELKVELTLKAKLSDIASLILDINNYYKWSYNTKLSYVLKQVSKNEIYYYSEVKSPWPASNRDLIVHLKMIQDPLTKIMTINATSVPNFIPPKKNLVRVPFSNETWTVIPAIDTNVKITYFLQIDPGESAPAWLINIFATKAPFESFKNLSTQVKEHKQVPIAFIKD